MTMSPHIHRSTLQRACVAASLGAAIALSASGAQAGDAGRLEADWAKLALVLQSGPEALLPRSPAPESIDPLSPRPWVGAEPRLSLVARDWVGCRPLYGALSPSDELRPTQSSRMVVSRLRLTEGHIAPFVQVGLGEWRVDTSLFPALPRERELAAQVGFGFELSLGRGTVLAFESGWTFLEPQTSSDVLAQTHPALFSGILAARSRF